MKKLTAIMLALVLVLAMSASAYAASITITPPTLPAGASQDPDITYTAYKIFDATISGNNVAYTIDGDSPYYNAINAATDYFTLTKAAGSTNTYIVTVKDAYNEDAANSFADTLKAVNGNAAGTLSEQDNGDYKLDNLTDGYYLVTSSVGSDLILDTIGNITVNAKNSYPSLDKKVENADSTTADMGEVLPFSINVTIPEDAVGEIVVHDKMNGLEYQSMTTVDGITVTTADLSDDCTVHFTLSADYVKTNLGKTVTISYKAKVTADIANNEAWLVDDTYTSTHDNTPVYSTDIVIDKFETGNNDIKLSGAKFVLRNAENNYYSYNEETKAVTWVENQEGATVVTTDENGKAEFRDIADGTYQLIETEAPTGYNLLDKPVSVIVTASVQNEQVVDITAEVENSSGSELPSTGGMGTTIFYVVGGLMVTLAVVILVAKKKVGAGK